jgi:hypothetical protein
MCCHSKTQQTRWYQALKEFDGPADTNIGDDILDFLSIKPTPPTQRTRKMTAAARLARGLRRASFGQAPPLSNNYSSQADGFPVHHPRTPLLLFVSLNTLVFLSRTASISNFWLCVIVINVIMKKAISLKMPRIKGILDANSKEEEGEEFAEEVRREKMRHDLARREATRRDPFAVRHDNVICTSRLNNVASLGLVSSSHC